MDAQTLITDLEAKADMAGVPVYVACQRAGVAPSSFYRWKAGNDFMVGTLAKVSRAIDEIEAERAA